jgi:fatty acid desaturase
VNSFLTNHYRVVLSGCANLGMPLWLKPVYLNFNLHLAHHQNPRIPWIHLLRFIASGRGRMSFFRNYVRLWKGPRLSREPNPELHKETVA